MPFKDFDFIGKHVVCQKCYQKFASKTSYRAHVGTDICIKTYNGPNLVYLKYKYRNCRQTQKKNKTRKYMEDLNNYDIKKNILNPEMLNTLQTRNNCYSDNIIHQRNKVKEKQVNSSNKNYDSSIKKPRGRPRKNIDIEPKKPGKPKKFDAITGSSSSQSDNSIDNNFENYITVNTPIIVSVGSYNVSAYNVNVTKKQKLEYTMESLTESFWKLMSAVWNPDKDIIDRIHKISNERQYETHNVKKEITNDLLYKDKDISFKFETLEKELKSLSSQFEEINDFSYEEELESMLSKLIEKRNEYKQHKLKKTGMNNGSTTNKGKENIQCTLKKNEEDMEINKNKIDFDQNEKVVWLNNDNRGNISTPTITVILNSSNIDDCKSIDCADIEELNLNSTNKDNFEEIVETIKKDVTPNSTNSVLKKISDTDFHLISSHKLTCKFCSKMFVSIAEWKMHISEHMAMVSKNLLCKVCGHKFKVYKNFIKHMNIHGKIGRTDTKIHYKNLKCGICNRQYNYLRSYYAHMKTHGL